MARDRTGVLFVYEDDDETVQRTEELGYHSLWCAEGPGRSQFVRLSRWAALTDEIELGTGITNVYTRTPGNVTMDIATVDEFSGGRARLGLGVSHKGIVSGFHGVPFRDMLPRMREYIILLKRYFSQVDEPYEGEFHSPQSCAFWEGFDPPRAELPVYNGAIGPQNIRLTGELADGWFPVYYPPHLFRRGLGWLEEGAERANRDVEEIDVALVTLAVVNEDRERARLDALRQIANYTNYEEYFERLGEDAGYDEEVRLLNEALPEVASVADRISDEFLDAISVFGTPREARDKLNELCRETGVDQPVLLLSQTSGRETHLQTLEALAP